MIDENRFEIQNTQSRNIAVLAGNAREIFQGIVIERTE